MFFCPGRAEVHRPKRGTVTFAKLPDIQEWLLSSNPFKKRYQGGERELVRVFWTRGYPHSMILDKS